MIEPICVFKPGEDCRKAIRDLQISLSDDIRNRRVVVVSVAGRFRQGKSFLMNFILRYLRAGGATDWMEKGADETLDGFAWQHTKNPVTLGVLFWPEIFQLTDGQGRDIAVLLMDTQGAFDSRTTMAEKTSISALSVLLSSIQILNIKQNLQGDDISDLQFFAEIGRLICSDRSGGASRNNHKPFQELIFMVRDWIYEEENPHGWDGGAQLLEEVLEMGNTEDELVSQRASIESCFDQVRCFLMPYPGEIVATSKEFRGKLSEIDDKFKDRLKVFIEDIFWPSNIETKRINGKEITVGELLLSVEAYVDVLRSGNLPKAEPLYAATVRATNSALVNRCFGVYQERFQELYTDPRDPVCFEDFHDTVTSAVISDFDGCVKMGDENAIAAARNELKERIIESKQYFLQINSATWDRKHIEAQLERAIREQRDIGELFIGLSGETRVLTQRLLAAEEKTGELLESLKKKEREVQEVTSAWGKMKAWCWKLLNWNG